jgi:transposase InsO family protein
VKYAAIARYVGRHSIRLMCRALQVSPAGFYASQRRQPAARAIADARLTLEITAIHNRSDQTYGSPRIHEELRAREQYHGRKRIVRLMQAAGLVSKRPRPYRSTTDSGHGLAVAANLLQRRFTETRPDHIWVADVTAVPTGEGWLFLAALLDLASRRVIGWTTSATPNVELVRKALEQALQSRRPAAALLHHSDQGSVYASVEYRALLATHGIRQSMNRIANCWDNAVAESFFATLKTELVHHIHWRTRAQATSAIADFIDRWYNRQRRHSSLGYISPVEYELKHQRAA